MRILITGASGFLGGHLVEQFAAEGHEVRALVRRTSRTGLLEKLGVEIERGDLKDTQSLRRAVQGVDVVVHAASTMAGAAAEYEAAAIEGTRSLLAVAEESGVKRFIHISSISVINMARLSRGKSKTEDAPYEDDPRFLTNYVKSKIGSEQAAVEFAVNSKMSVIVLRPGILYGPRGNWNLSRLGFPLGKSCYLTIGSGRTPLPVCYVGNCAQAALMAAQRPHVVQGVFNIVDDEGFTQMEYLKRLRAEVRPRLKILRIPYVLWRLVGWMGDVAAKVTGLPNPLRSGHLIACHRRIRYANDRAKEVLGRQPQTGKDEALTKTLRYFLKRETVSRRANIRVLGLPALEAKPVRSCLIGCGVIAQTHLKVLDRMGNANVVALCDSNRDAARQLARQHKILHTYSNASEMLRSEQPDLVHILTPPQSHAGLTELAFHNGCHVLVEKPMAVNAQEARRMVELATKTGQHLCVGHNHLYDPVIVRARKQVELGELGDILWVESYYGFDLGSNPSARYLLPGGDKHWTFDLPGGLFQNLAPHPISLAVEVLGNPSKVLAHGRSGRVLPHQRVDEMRILLETPRASGLVTVSLAASPRFHYLNIFGTRGALFVDLLNKWVVPQIPAKGIPKPISRAMMNLKHGWRVLTRTFSGTVKVVCRRWTPYDGLGILIKEYYAAIQERRRPPVSLSDAIAVMEIMDETWKQLGPLDHPSAGQEAG